MKVTQICRERERVRESDREVERETDGEGRESGRAREVWEREGEM